MKTFPRHTLYHLSTYFGERELFGRDRNIAARPWRGRKVATLNIYGVETLLSVDHRATGIF